MMSETYETLVGILKDLHEDVDFETCETLIDDKILDSFDIITVITEISNAMRNPKKFADAGMVPGTRLSMESHAPLGGLLRIKLLGSSLALHRNDGKNIMVKLS